MCQFYSVDFTLVFRSTVTTSLSLSDFRNIAQNWGNLEFFIPLLFDIPDEGNSIAIAGVPSDSQNSATNYRVMKTD